VYKFVHLCKVPQSLPLINSNHAKVLHLRSHFVRYILGPDGSGFVIYQFGEVFCR
jgi:hypothetical protein